MKKAVKIIITGTVQGVFFRNFVKESADKLGLKGFVRNLENGDIEIVAEGDGNSIEQMMDICKKGPKFAQIRNVITEERKYSGEYTEFKVLRF
jgi:acylphosphatase